MPLKARSRGCKRSFTRITRRVYSSASKWMSEEWEMFGKLGGSHAQGRLTVEYRGGFRFSNRAGAMRVRPSPLGRYAGPKSSTTTITQTVANARNFGSSLRTSCHAALPTTGILTQCSNSFITHKASRKSQSSWPVAPRIIHNTRLKSNGAFRFLRVGNALTKQRNTMLLLRTIHI